MLEKNHFPELIFGIAGPIGVDIDAISISLSEALKRVSYTSDTIKLTTDMMAFHSHIKPPSDANDYAAMMHFKINYADDLCERRADPAFMARIAIQSIRRHRIKSTKNFEKPAERHAYIVRQFKRPEEIEIMRTVYGQQFVLISAYASASARRNAMETRIRKTQSTALAASAILVQAEELIERDASEGDRYAGQQLRDTFHLGDVFISGLSRTEMDDKLARFVAAFFGRTDSAPTKDEFGMYAARSASFRSCDLSRQVGAAVFTTDGELIVQGCNEVPKAFGGAYWDQEEPDFRDVKLGNDPNDEHKHELLRDLFERLWKANLLSDEAKESQSPENLLNKLISRKKIEGKRGVLGSRLN
jgi:cytidine deaminase